MTSGYLSPEATEEMRDRVLRRIADEALYDAHGTPGWSQDSDYWRLPLHVRREVHAMVFDQEQPEDSGYE